MSLHDADVKARLMRFLDRKTTPRRLEGKPTAMEDEVRALAAAVTRIAPRDPEKLADWWPVFEARLSEECGQMWPTEKEIRDASQQTAKDTPQVFVSQGQSDEHTPEAITGRRMAAGEAVGEEWLYGARAVALIAAGHVSKELMGRYRSAALHQRCEGHGGREAALAWEAEAKARHEAAKAIHRDRMTNPQRRDTTFTPRKMPVAAE